MLLLLTAACAHNDTDTPAKEASPETTQTAPANPDAKANHKPDAPKPEAKPKPDRASVVQQYIQAAQVAETQGDYLAAATYRAALVEAQPDDRAMLSQLVAVAAKAGLRNHTVGALARYSTTHPDDVGMRTELGAALLADNRPEPAAEALRTACADTASDWRACSLAGVAEDRLQRFAAAQEFYIRALKRSPDNAAVLNNYALSLALSGNTDAARTIARKLLSRNDLSPRIRDAMKDLAA